MLRTGADPLACRSNGMDSLKHWDEDGRHFDLESMRNLKALEYKVSNWMQLIRTWRQRIVINHI